MDLKHLIESCQYRYEDLTERQKNFVDGLEAAKETIDSFKGNYEICLSADIPSLQKILDEIVTKLLDGLIDYLESDIAEAIVSFADSNACKADSKGG